MTAGEEQLAFRSVPPIVQVIPGALVPVDPDLLNGHSVTAAVAASPDCRAAKHTACSGDAWDVVRDEPAACPCSCHQGGGA